MALRRILIANRGEIALRIVRAARSLGIGTVLAASAADRDSIAAREADRIVVIGPAAARNSYLNPRLIVHAAKATGCDGLHPGYGFLSERQSSPRFAREDGCRLCRPDGGADSRRSATSCRRAASPQRPGSR